MIILDTETTGLPKPSAAGLDAQPHIIEFAAVKVDVRNMKIIDRIEFLCKPPIVLPKDVPKWSGITEAMLEGKPSFGSHFEELAQFFLAESEGVAHNAAFDFALMEFEMTRARKMGLFPWPMRRICTVEATHHIKNHRIKLGDLYKMATGKEIQNAHRAMGDVESLYEIVCWMHKKGMPL